MSRNSTVEWFAIGTAALICATSASAADFNIPGGDLKAALDTYARETGSSVIYREDAVQGVQSRGVSGNLNNDTALSRILSGTGFVMRHHPDGTTTIFRDKS